MAVVKLFMVTGTHIAEACRHCDAPLAAGAHFCQSCGRVQPPAPVDAFAFFGLPRKLDLDAAQLEREFYRLSRKLHPDVYARASAEEQAWSLEKSSQLNDAYRALRDPIARTEALLRLEGVELEEQSRAATDRARHTGEEKKQVVPPELLEEVFELNMQLQELKMGERDPEIVSQLEAARKSFTARLDAIGNELRALWSAWDKVFDRDAADAERLRVRDRMVALLNRRSYMRNLVRDVNDAIGH